MVAVELESDNVEDGEEESEVEDAVDSADEVEMVGLEMVTEVDWLVDKAELEVSPEVREVD